MPLTRRQQETIENNIIFAIQNKLQMRIYYSGYVSHGIKPGYRTIEPYVYGYGPTGEIYLRAYAVDGVSRTGEMPGWKLFFKWRITKANVRFKKFIPRAEYVINDSFITARLATVLQKNEKKSLMISQKHKENPLITMNMNNADYPIYQAVINPEDNETGVRLVSIVDEPAIERYFVAMSKNNPVKGSSVHLSSDEKRIITGAVMVPDKLIYRNADEKIKTDYYIQFSAETILECAKKYFRLNSQNQANIDHKENNKTDGVTGFESWIIINSKLDKSIALGMEEHPVGTWMFSYHITDNAVWQKIKSGEVKGFSLEGFFDYLGAIEPKEVNNQKQTDMNNILLQVNKLFAEIKTMLSDGGAALVIEDWTLQDGTMVKYNPDTKEITNADGSPMADGNYILQDGKTITVQGGILIDMKDPEVEAKSEDGNTEIKATAEGGKVALNSRKQLAFEVDAEGKASKTPLANGHYSFEDGTVIDVNNGKYSLLSAASLKKFFEEQLQTMSSEYENTKGKIQKLKDKNKELETELLNTKTEFDKFKTEFEGQKPANTRTDNFEWAGEKKDIYKEASGSIQRAFEKANAKK